MKSAHGRRARATQPGTSRLGVGVKRSVRVLFHKGSAFDRAMSSVKKGNRIVIGRGDDDVAALVPLRDYRLLELLSPKRGDVLALLAALEAEAAAARKAREAIPWKTARQRLQ